MELKTRQHYLLASQRQIFDRLEGIAELCERVSLGSVQRDANRSANIEIFGVERNAADHTGIVVRRFCNHRLSRYAACPEHLVTLQHDEERARRAGEFFDLNADRRFGLEHDRLGEWPERAVGVGDAEPSNVVNRLALIFTPRAAGIEAVEKAHLFSRHGAGFEDSSESPGGDLLDRQIGREETIRLRIESETSCQISSALLQ